MTIQYLTDKKGRKKAIQIPIKEWNALKKRYKIEDDYLEPTKEEIKQNILQGLKEAKMHERGEIHLPTAYEALANIKAELAEEGILWKSIFQYSFRKT